MKVSLLSMLLSPWELLDQTNLLHLETRTGGSSGSGKHAERGTIRDPISTTGAHETPLSCNSGEFRIRINKLRSFL
eukprot:706376-Rhodomonas_salina.2